MTTTDELADRLPRLRGAFYDHPPGDPLRQVPNLVADLIDHVRKLEAKVQEMAMQAISDIATIEELTADNERLRGDA